MENQSQDELLPVKSAAKRANVHPNTIRNLIRRGDLKAVRIGKKSIRIRSTDLEALFTPVVGGDQGIWKR